MSVDFNGTTQWYSTTTLPTIAFPISFSVRFNLDTLPTVHGDEEVLMALSDNTFDNFFNLRLDDGSTDKLQMNMRTSAVLDIAQTVNAVTTGSWLHAYGQCDTDDIKAVLGGDTANAGTDTSTGGRNPSASMTHFGIGAFPVSSSSGDEFDGKICEATIRQGTNCKLSNDEIKALADGADEWLVRPETIIFYLPMWRTNHLTDLAGSITMTANNVPANGASHAPAFYRYSRQIILPATVVGGANPKGPLGMPFYGPFAGPLG